MLVPGRELTLLAGAATGLLALWVWALRPGDRVHRLLALFLVLRAAVYLLLPFSSPTWDLQGRLLVYPLLALPFAAAAFALTFLQDHGAVGVAPASRSVRWSRTGLLVAALAVETWYLVDHGAFDSPLEGRLIVLVAPLTYLTYAALGLIALIAASRQTDALGRTALGLLGLGFGLEPAFWAAFQVSDGRAWSAGVLPLVSEALFALAALVSLASLGLLVARARHRALRPFALRAAGALLLALGTGVALRHFVPRLGLPEAVHALWRLDALWHLALVGLVVVAVLRYALFDLDLRIARSVSASAVGAAFAGAFLLGSEVLERFVPVEGTVLGILAAVGIAFALRPIQHAAERAARALAPGLATTEAALDARKTEIYRAAVVTARSEGGTSPREERFLERLREQLGIPEGAAGRIETEAGATRR